MRKRQIVRLTQDERAQLHRLISVGQAPARKLTHARILLQADQGPAGPGWTDEEIVEALAVGEVARDLGAHNPTTVWPFLEMAFPILSKQNDVFLDYVTFPRLSPSSNQANRRQHSRGNGRILSS